MLLSVQHGFYSNTLARYMQLRWKCDDRKIVGLQGEIISVIIGHKMFVFASNSCLSYGSIASDKRLPKPLKTHSALYVFMLISTSGLNMAWDLSSTTCNVVFYLKIIQEFDVFKMCWNISHDQQIKDFPQESSEFWRNLWNFQEIFLYPRLTCALLLCLGYQSYRSALSKYILFDTPCILSIWCVQLFYNKWENRILTRYIWHLYQTAVNSLTGELFHLILRQKTKPRNILFICNIWSKI